MPPLQCIAFMGLNACPELLATPQICDTYDRTSVKWVTQSALYFFKKVFLGRILDKWTECSFISEAGANEATYSARPLLKVVEMGDQPILSSSFPGRSRDPKLFRRKHVFPPKSIKLGIVILLR